MRIRQILIPLGLLSMLAIACQGPATAMSGTNAPSRALLKSPMYPAASGIRS